MFTKLFLSLGIFLLFSPAFFLGEVSIPKAHALPKIECVSFLPGCKILRVSTGGDYKKNIIFTELLPKALNWIFRVSAALAVLMGVVSGAMFVVGGGNEQLRGRATRTAVYSIFGLLLAMFSYFIVNLIERLPFPGA